MPIHHRRCLCCRKVAPKAEFIRIVRLHPSFEIAIESGMGRSAYLCPTFACLQTVQKKDRLSRALKAPVPQQIYQTLKQKISALHAQTPPEIY